MASRSRSPSPKSPAGQKGPKDQQQHRGSPSPSPASNPGSPHAPGSPGNVDADDDVLNTDTAFLTHTCMPSSVFVYGTLQSNDVLQMLLGRVPTKEMCMLCDPAKKYHVYPVRDECFPGLCTEWLGPLEGEDAGEEEGPVILGQLLKGLSTRDLKLLDFFEDDEYVLTPVSVELVSGMLAGEDADLAASLGGAGGPAGSAAAGGGTAMDPLTLSPGRAQRERAARGGHAPDSGVYAESPGFTGHARQKRAQRDGAGGGGDSAGLNAVAVGGVAEAKNDTIGAAGSGKMTLASSSSSEPRREPALNLGEGNVVNTVCFVYHPEFVRNKLRPGKWDYARDFAAKPELLEEYLQMCRDTRQEFEDTWETKFEFQ